MSEESQQSSSCSDSQEQERKQKKKEKKVQIYLGPSPVPPLNAKIIINLALTHYDVIQEVAQQLQWKIQRQLKPNNYWDVLWTDHHIQPQLLIRMQLYQKVSHLPGIHVLSRKNLLGISLMDMYRQAPQHYNFFPKTWLLPNQYGQLRKEFVGQKTFIVKPQADCQGKGIFLTQSIEDVENGKHYVVQQYISRPLLVEGLKFDFRVYVLVCGIMPLRIYIYQEGLARFATEPYIAPNKNNLKKQYMHLTNYAINKKNPKFVYNSSSNRMDVGHKRSLTSVLKIIEKRGHNLAQIKQNINDCIIKTLLLGHPLVAHQYRFCQPHDEQRNMCFHILGIDVMLDADCKPYVLEVNHTPSFVTDTPLDHYIKYSLIKDTLILMNINKQTRNKALQCMNKIQKQKNLGRPKRQLYQNFDKQERVKLAQQQRDRYQNANIGRFTKILPHKNQQKQLIYQQLLIIAEKSYFSQNNVLRAQMQKQKANQQQKLKKTINEEQLSPLRKKKVMSSVGRASEQLDRSSPDLIHKSQRNKVQSFYEPKINKKTILSQMIMIEKDLISNPTKKKNQNNIMIRPSNSITLKNSTPKTLPRIINQHSTQSNSPLKSQISHQSSGIYRKKVFQIIKIQQQQKKQGDIDLKIIKQICKTSKKQLIRVSNKDHQQQSDESQT